jgi:hypothetical protein
LRRDGLKRDRFGKSGIVGLSAKVTSARIDRKRGDLQLRST